MNDKTFKIVKAVVVAVAGAVAKGLVEILCNNVKEKLDEKNKKEEA